MEKSALEGEKCGAIQCVVDYNGRDQSSNP